jgi:hypothetical protein
MQKDEALRTTALEPEGLCGKVIVQDYTVCSMACWVRLCSLGVARTRNPSGQSQRHRIVMP